jgi:hypothetical protein
MELFPDLPMHALTAYRCGHIKPPRKILFGPDVAEAMAEFMKANAVLSVPCEKGKLEFCGIRFGYMLAPGVAIVK